MTYRLNFIPLPALCKIQTGYTARGKLQRNPSDGVRAVQLRDIQGQDTCEPEDAPRYDVEAASERHWARPGDVLFRSRGEQTTAVLVAPAASEAVVAILPLLILRPNRTLVDPAYLAWIINQPISQQHFDSCAQGTSMRMIGRVCLDDLEIPVPDLDTQRRIVAIDRLSEREHALMGALSEKKRLLTSLLLLKQAQSPGPSGEGNGVRKARAVD